MSIEQTGCSDIWGAPSLDLVLYNGKWGHSRVMTNKTVRGLLLFVYLKIISNYTSF